MTSRHCSSGHLVEMPSRVMPALLTSTSMGPSGLGDFGEALGAGVVIADVPFVDRDAGLGLELLCRGVVAGVVRGDAVALVLQCCGNGVANATRATSNNGNARHECSSSLETGF